MRQIHVQSQQKKIGKRLQGNINVLIVDFEHVFADWDNLNYKSIRKPN